LDDNGSRCKTTVDGTDFRIQEPQPFDEKWYSEKFNGPGVRYEVCVNIQNGWIVNINGPYPCGAWPDIRIARDELCHLLANSEFEDEMAVADGGYQDGFEFFETPTGLSNDDQHMKAVARARHETINRRFKTFNILKAQYRGKPVTHGYCFFAIANITQYLIECVGHEMGDRDDEGLWMVEYFDRPHEVPDGAVTDED